MKRTLIAFLFLSLCGCGLEAVGTAATSASMKKQELEEGQRTMQRMKGSIEQMNLQATDRLREAEREAEEE
jgi:hypothetical protein